MKTIYLTIDDAPSAKFRERVDFLCKKNIPAIFFCLGRNLEQYPKDVVHAIKQGFVIANHSWDHPHFSEISLDFAQDQIVRTDTLIDALYAQAGVERTKKYFRFPYGDTGDNFLGIKAPSELKQKRVRLQRLLCDLGFTSPSWPDITYGYFQPYKQDVDWAWTLDFLEWTTDSKYHSKYGLHTIDDVLKRIQANDPEHGFGLNYHKSADIALTHDQINDQELFTPIIAFLIEHQVSFKLPE